ncbi:MULTISPECIES: SDR family NAD(P)-dependent oxidoreductase [Haloarcula]|uniref:SDR family NAD(P)-dependent oxidoreductase n=1 Tax=Haloarcula TaxID=2237 RepID=UPI0023E8F876|nr:SDR family NAD(P)-dependent oxidoreductase [Halomicroarcula sp. SHR3]
MTADDEQVGLVTGAGSDIGAATALAFAEAGWTVYATDVETPLPERVSERCRCLELDVTSDEQCQAVVDQITERTGGIDCLVNNAGYAAPGPTEDVATDDVRAMFDVLAAGPHRLAKAVLPEMRHSGGRIVNVSSILAKCAYSGLGAYCAGKAALSSMTDALRMELADNPAVHVALVEPAWGETNFAEHARSKLPDERTPEYDATYEALEDGWLLECEPLAEPPEAVAEHVLEAATDPEPRARYPVGPSGRVAQLTKWLPPRLADPIQLWFGRVSTQLRGWV